VIEDAIEADNADAVRAAVSQLRRAQKAVISRVRGRHWYTRNGQAWANFMRNRKVDLAPPLPDDPLQRTPRECEELLRGPTRKVWKRGTLVSVYSREHYKRITFTAKLGRIPMTSKNILPSSGIDQGSTAVTPIGGHTLPSSTPGAKLAWKYAQKNPKNSISSDSTNSRKPSMSPRRTSPPLAHSFLWAWSRLVLQCQTQCVFLFSRSQVVFD